MTDTRNPLETVVAAAASRRRFLRAGLAIPAAAVLGRALPGSLARAGSAAAQDEKTLVVALPQATVQLDPSIAGSRPPSASATRSCW